MEIIPPSDECGGGNLSADCEVGIGDIVGLLGRIISDSYRWQAASKVSVDGDEAVISPDPRKVESSECGDRPNVTTDVPWTQLTPEAVVPRRTSIEGIPARGADVVSISSRRAAVRCADSVARSVRP